MQCLEIISFSATEVQQICAAAHFLQNSLQIRFRCPEDLVRQLQKAFNPLTDKFLWTDRKHAERHVEAKNTALTLHTWEPLAVRKTKAQNVINCFASLESFFRYTQLGNSVETTLILHPQCKILLYPKDGEHTWKLLKNNIPCCLRDEKDLPTGLHKEAVCHNSFRSFLAEKSGSNVLLTNNLGLLSACLMQDSGNWAAYHTESQCYNLLADYRSDLSKALLQTLKVPKAEEALKDRNDLELFQSLMQLQDDSYSFFAEHYDDYMSHVNYEQWIDKVLSWQKQYSALPVSKVIELACGTANISSRLVNRGFEVDACDLSVAMLQVANRKANKPRLFQAGLTDSLPYSNYSLAICMFDSLNYLLKTSQISKMLQEIHASLAEDGLLIFDISTLNNSQENFEDLCNLQMSANGYLLHQAWFQSLQMLQRSSLHYFKKQGFGYTLQVEQHSQRVYRVSELVELISRSPLKLVAIHSLSQKSNLYPRHLQSIDTKYPRLFFVLRKTSHE